VEGCAHQVPARIYVEDFRSAVARPADAAGSGSSVAARQQEDRQDLWQHVLLMMLVVLGLEGFVASRTT
jgi:hypothetical protein